MPSDRIQNSTSALARLCGAAALSLAALALASCGTPEDDTGKPLPTTAAGAIDYGELDGDVKVDGSSTVFPISEAAAEDFAKVARGVQAVCVPFQHLDFVNSSLDLITKGSRPVNCELRP